MTRRLKKNRRITDASGAFHYVAGMTPAPPSAPAAAPAKYTMPIVALVLAIVGLCLPCVSWIGGIMGIVAWVRISKQPHLPNKGFAIAATFIPLATIPIIGIQAAIAIPNFIKYQARAKQTECKMQLRSIYTAAQMFQAEKGKYPKSFADLAITPMQGNRYSYFLSPTEARLGPGGQADASALERAGVVFPEDDASFTAACVGNIDSDGTLDVWEVSSEPAPDGTPPGMPHAWVDDVNG